MLRRILVVFLIVSITCVTCVSTSAQETTQTQEALQATLEASFQTELTIYAKTHTPAEVVAYAQARLNAMTTEAVLPNPDGSVNLFSELFAEEPILFYDPSITFGGGGGGSGQLAFCLRTRGEECRRTYNSELFASAAVSTGMMAGCVAITVGSGLIICAAAALVAHALAIAAARERYSACNSRAQSDCYLQYGGPR
jgi:hypothetical protein